MLSLYSFEIVLEKSLHLHRHTKIESVHPTCKLQKKEKCAFCCFVAFFEKRNIVI